VKNSEPEDAGHCCKTRLAQRGEEPASPDYLFRDTLQKKGLREDHHSHNPPRPVRNPLIPTSKTEGVDKTGDREIHRDCNENHPHHPQQGSMI